MEFMKIFKRQKSSKLKKNEENLPNDSADRPGDFNLESHSPQRVDKNSKSKLEPFNEVQKDFKGWRNSFRKMKKRKQDIITSTSCDDILKQRTRASISFAAEHKNSVDTKAAKWNLNRWSYSPDSNASTALMLTRRDDTHLQPGRMYLIQNEFSTHRKPCKISQQSKQCQMKTCLDMSCNCHFLKHDMDLVKKNQCQTKTIVKSKSTGSLAAEFCALPLNGRSQSVGNLENTVFEDVKTRESYEIFNERSFKKEYQPHSTLYEREADHILDSLKQAADLRNCVPYNVSAEESPGAYEEIDDTEDNLSWATNEFDSDVDASDEYDNDEELEKNQNNNTTNEDKNKFGISKHKELTKSVRKLKFLERKVITPKRNFKEEHPIFVDFHISNERHPGPQLQPPAFELLPYQLKRRNIVKTIIQSESSYIDSLERLEISYRKSLLECKPAIISSEMVEKIFYKIADILQCHQLFQIALAAAVKNWDEHETIGDTFVASFSKSMVLECYSSYINNFTSAMEIVRKTCVRKPQFLTFLRDRQNESENRINLYGLMLKPVQRFPQFIMLVQDLLKHTPKEHDDRLPLQLALTELETLTAHLNQRRADDEEKADMINLLDSSNIKLLSNFTKDGRTRRLLKKGFVRECIYSDDGVLEKDRECLLMLTNDMLLSCSCTNRKQPQRSGISTFRDLYKLKWCAPLDIVKVTDGYSASALEYSRIKNDHQLLNSINEMVKSLTFSYDTLSTQQITQDITCLDWKLEQAENVMEHSCDSFNVSFRQKSDDFKRTLVMSDRMQCNEWMENIINAKLANESKNLHCWFSADGSDSEYLWKPPLFLDSVDCLSNQKTLQVQCAIAFMPANHYTLLWLACSASTVVAIVNIYQIMDEKIEKIHVMQVESSVQCMEHWNSLNKIPSIWLGMECGSLIEFSADTSYSKLCEIPMPTMSTVMIMKGLEENLYVGLLDGSLLMYTRPEGVNDLLYVQSISVGYGPLSYLSLLDGKLWGASGNDIVTLNLEDFSIESIHTIQTEEPLTVSHIVQVGSGLWVAFCDTCNLHLYHRDSLKLLQDLNLSRPVRDFFQSLGWQSRVNEKCFVTSMWSSYCQLIVGTSSGLILTMPLPKLSESVPKITGPCRICYHMLNGPITFLCAPLLPEVVKSNENESSKVTSVTGENFPFMEIQDEKPPKIPERSPINQTYKSPNEPKKFRHKRTSSEGVINVSESVATSSVTKKRFSSVEPFNSSFLSDSVHKFNPPALPPKPCTPRMEEVSCEELPEDDLVYTKPDLENIQTPNKTNDFPWKECRSRNFPILLACGEGYSYPQGIGKSCDMSHRATTLICWKITT